MLMSSAILLQVRVTAPKSSVDRSVHCRRARVRLRTRNSQRKDRHLLQRLWQGAAKHRRIEREPAGDRKNSTHARTGGQRGYVAQCKLPANALCDKEGLHARVT